MKAICPTTRMTHSICAIEIRVVQAFLCPYGSIQRQKTLFGSCFSAQHCHKYISYNVTGWREEYKCFSVLLLNFSVENEKMNVLTQTVQGSLKIIRI